MSYRVLVVDTDARTLAGVVDRLNEVAYDAVGAATFDEARRHLQDTPPDLLITAVRLGPFNGLQLVLRARLDYPDTPVIVTHPRPDAALQAEAACFGATWIPSADPWDVTAAAARIFAARPM